MSTVVVSKPGVSVPSYLSYFETEYEKIHLIYEKRPSLASDNENYCSPVKYEKEDIIDACDLTGDPLKIDLDGDDDIQISKIEPEGYSWSNDESKHFSLTVREARRELNKILRNPEPDPNGLPVYVICNGDDQHNTIVLGADRKSLMACGIHALGYIEMTDDEIATDDMMNEHYNNCNRKDIEVKYLVKIKYNLYGQMLRNLPCQNASMRDLEKHASVSVDVTSNQRVFRVLENTKPDIAMNLELIAGHKLLRLNFLWKEMCILQSYIDILIDTAASASEDTVLCDYPLDSDVILQNISNVVRTEFIKRPPKKVDLDLDNLRHENFLDRLWNILKNCENIWILRNSFHFLFEELADSNVQVLHAMFQIEQNILLGLPSPLFNFIHNVSISVYLWSFASKTMSLYRVSGKIEDKYSRIAFIINGILRKNVVLPAISLAECVELLFELGAQKLKFDSEVILDHFSNMARANIESVWKTFYQTDPRKSQSTARITRVTQYINSVDSVVKSRQLAYLCQLYVASEFIYLINEQIYLQEDSFYSFCQQVVKKYVENPKVIEDFVEVDQTPLCEMSCKLDINNVEFIQSASFPSRWTMYMTSEVNSQQVTTVYDLSESPIFPPAIYNWDIPTTNETLIYYVSKMNRTKEVTKKYDIKYSKAVFTKNV